MTVPAPFEVNAREHTAAPAETPPTEPREHGPWCLWLIGGRCNCWATP